MKKISLIIPAFNEEGNIAELYKQIEESIKQFNNYYFEFVIIENGSTDNTYDEILKIKKYDERVKCLKLSRNFKMDGGIAAGLDYVDSDAAIIMTANLQDDYKVIKVYN